MKEVELELHLEYAVFKQANGTSINFLAEGTSVVY